MLMYMYQYAHAHIIDTGHKALTPGVTLSLIASEQAARTDDIFEYMRSGSPTAGWGLLTL